MLKRILKKVRGFSPVELVIMVGFAALVAGALIYLGTTPHYTASTQPVDVNIKVAGGAAASNSTAVKNAALALEQSDLDILLDAVNSVDAQRMYDIMAHLSDTNGLAANGRYAGENTDTEDYVLESLENMGLTSYKQPFNFHFSKINSASIKLFKKNADGSFIEDPLLLPKLRQEPVDWDNPPVDLNLNDSNLYASPLWDSSGKVMANWEYRNPIPGIDFTVWSRSDSVALEKVEIDGTSDSNIDPHKMGNKIMLDPEMHYVNAKHAYENGAKGYISNFFPYMFYHLSDFSPGWLSEDRHGEAFEDFAQLGVSGLMAVELYQRINGEGGCFMDINIDVTAKEMLKEYGEINNIIGEIPGDPGSPYKDEVVIISAHFDGQGTQPGTPGKTTKTTDLPTTPLAYPSANDNGSGIAVMMEIARVMSDAYKEGWKPTRTIRFIGFNAEEMWFVGAEEYLKNIGNDGRDKIVAAINFDILNEEAVLHSGAVISNLEKYQYLWNILSQALVDAQLDNDICLQDNMKFPKGLQPQFVNECEGKFFRYVSVASIGPVGYESGQSYKPGWWVDMMAFRDYNVPSMNIGITTLPTYLSSKFFQRHNPYDNIANNAKLGWEKHFPAIAKFIAASALEMGMANESLKGKVQYAQ